MLMLMLTLTLMFSPQANAHAHAHAQCSCLHTCLVSAATGKLSGQAAVTSRLQGLGYSLTKEQMADIFIRFKVRVAWTAALSSLQTIDAYPCLAKLWQKFQMLQVMVVSLTSLNHKLVILRHSFCSMNLQSAPENTSPRASGTSATT